jgi:HD-GYP domain-containing protein (c-di-GMP phosphodiesterase class II)
MSTAVTSDQPRSEYIPVDMSAFAAGRPPLVDLYQLIQGQYVLYCESNVSLAKETRLRLLKSGVGVLYVRVAKGGVEAAGLDLPELLALPDSELHASVKANLLNNLATSAVREAFVKPDEESLGRTQNVSSATVAHLIRTPDSLSELIRAMRHDSSLYSHAANVMTYATGIGIHVGLGRDDLLRLSLGALLHDIGKTRIPRAILDTPVSLLTTKQQTRLRDHVALGERLLGNNASRQPVARIIILQHHERLDGSGYPNGLHGEDIPLVARVVAVADVFDALVSERPYKHAWPTDEGVDYLKSQRGKHFDPTCVDAFLADRAKIDAIITEFGD